MSRAAIPILLLGVLLLTCCSPHFTTHQPSLGDLAAEYVPTDGTLKRLKSEGYASRDISITLGPGGALSFRNIPDCWLTPYGDPNGSFDSGSGRWNLAQNYAVWAVTFSIDRFSPDSPHRDKGAFLYSHCATITRNQPPHGLAIAIAAGDAGYLEFRRR